MTLTTLTPQVIQNYLSNNLISEDQQVQVSVKRTSLGWLKIRIITKCFEGKELVAREQKIDDLLTNLDRDLNLGQYPIAGYDLLTPQESTIAPLQYKGLPLWSDILMAPEPDEPMVLDEESSKKPLVITFYSFKGGVGRSTALGLVAGILTTRNRRVVIVDLDLEAPGISILLKSDLENTGGEQYGVLDYLYQRYLTPEQDIPNIGNCIRQINLQTRGELFLIPVGEYDENYIHRLADLDMSSFYRRGTNAVEQLMEDIKIQLDPDVILIDARPGFNDMGAIALFDLADTGIICFSPTEQSFEGLHWVVQAARKQQEYQGKPDIQFLITPVPPVAAEQHQIWRNKVENWIEDNWGVPNGTTVGQLYNEVLYNPNIATLSSLVNDVPQSLIDTYVPLADIIESSLPDIKSNIATKDINTRRQILHELSFQAATAQELEPANIPDIFQRTEDFPRLLNNRTWLIRGAKGTGKSLLFILFVEQPEAAKELALVDVDLNNVHFIAGHGQPRVSGTILENGALTSYEQQVGENNWKFFWLNYGLLQLCNNKPELSSLPGLDDKLVALSTQENPSQADIVSWLVERSQSAQMQPRAFDELRAIDLWLLYDELDAGFGSTPQDYERRLRALEALLAWWLESGTSLKQIIPKIFLREDIWNQLNFTNTGHYSGRSVQLRWEEADLWRLVLRQALKSSEILRKSLEQKLGVTVDRLNIIGLEVLRQSLYSLWGERMGRTKKAYTYNWIRNRIADGQNNCFPRSLILLLEEAVKLEKSFSTDYSSEITLRPKALIDAFPYVSQQRVAEVRNEYPELETFLQALQGERSPIDRNRLAQIWHLNVSKLSDRIKDIVEAGIFTELLPKNSPPHVYGIVELYLYGLGMVRKGQR